MTTGLITGTMTTHPYHALIKNSNAPRLIQRIQAFAPTAGDVGTLLFAELTYRTATEFYRRPYITAAFKKAREDRMCDVFVTRFAPCQCSDDLELLKLLMEWKLVPSERLIWLRFRPPLSYEAFEFDSMYMCGGSGITHLALLNSIFDEDKQTNLVNSILASHMSWYRLLIMSILSLKVDNVRLIADGIKTHSSMLYTNSKSVLTFRQIWIVFPSIMAVAACSVIGDEITPMLLEVFSHLLAQPLALKSTLISLAALRDSTRSVIQNYYKDYKAVAETRIAMIQ
jgi:hypothetical protein